MKKHLKKSTIVENLFENAVTSAMRACNSGCCCTTYTAISVFKYRRLLSNEANF